MSKLVKQTENELKIIIENAVNKAMASGDLPQAEIPQFNIEKPANKDNGDYSTNVAMAGARAFKKAPKMIAEAIEKYLDNQTLKHDMEVYRGEGRFDVFNSVVLDKEKNITLKDILEKFTANIEEHKFNEKAVDDFVDKSLLGQYIH